MRACRRAVTAVRAADAALTAEQTKEADRHESDGADEQRRLYCLHFEA